MKAQQDQITIGSRIIIHDDSPTTIILNISDSVEIELTPQVVKKLAEQLDASAGIAIFLERYRMMCVANYHTPHNTGLLTREVLKYMGGLNENSQATR